MNNLVLQNEITMTSLEVVDLINKFRLEEGNNKVKRHADLMESIRKEIETLETIGITSQRNFSLGSYLDKNNQERPCFKMNKTGIMMMLNKESALVRYKTQQYIEALENRLSTPQLTRKQELQLSILNGDEIERISSLKEYETLVTKPLITKIEEDKPKVEIADKRLLKNGCYTLTEVTKSLNLKRGQITKWAKEQGYIHKKIVEVNKQGEEYFKIYDNGGFKCIGITEQGLQLINKTLKNK